MTRKKKATAHPGGAPIKAKKAKKPKASTADTACRAGYERVLARGNKCLKKCKYGRGADGFCLKKPTTLLGAIAQKEGQGTILDKKIVVGFSKKTGKVQEKSLGTIATTLATNAVQTGASSVGKQIKQFAKDNPEVVADLKQAVKENAKSGTLSVLQRFLVLWDLLGEFWAFKAGDWVAYQIRQTEKGIKRKLTAQEKGALWQQYSDWWVKEDKAGRTPTLGS